MSGTDLLTQGYSMKLGPVTVTETVWVTWGLMILITVGSWLVTRRMKQDPGMVQAAVEGAVETVYSSVADVLPTRVELVMPFIATLWIFLVCANLIGVVPGLASPTSDLSATTALAALVFVSVHWYGVRTQGLRRYLAHYLDPSPMLLPFNVIGEITRTVALAVRLFGNMMSLGLTAMLVLLVAGFLAPIPILMLHIIEALVQAYIFGMLALIYIAGGIQVQESKNQIEGGEQS